MAPERVGVGELCGALAHFWRHRVHLLLRLCMLKRSAARCPYYVCAHAHEQGGSRMKFVFAKTTAAAALMCVALSGCIVAPVPAYEGEAVYQAPPAPQYEVVG